MSKLLKLTCLKGSQEGFTAYAVQRNDNVIEGIVRENEHTTYCIKGIRHETGEIAFLKVSCLDSQDIPCVFVFEDTGNGYLSYHELYFGFNKWSKDWTICVEEMDDKHLLDSVITRYKHKRISLDGIRKSLMDNYIELERLF